MDLLKRLTNSLQANSCLNWPRHTVNLVIQWTDSLS